MKFSYYCGHCGRHLRQGDHAACRKILKAERKEHEGARLAEGERTRRKYETGERGEALAKLAEGE